jgi:hypothetical protein
MRHARWAWWNWLNCPAHPHWRRTPRARSSCVCGSRQIGTTNKWALRRVGTGGGYRDAARARRARTRPIRGPEHVQRVEATQALSLGARHALVTLGIPGSTIHHAASRAVGLVDAKDHWRGVKISLTVGVAMTCMKIAHGPSVVSTRPSLSRPLRLIEIAILYMLNRARTPRALWLAYSS